MVDHQPTTHGIETEITEDGIFIIRVDNVHRHTVDALCDLLHKYDIEGMALRRHNRSMLVLHGNAYPTPYATHRMIKLSASTPLGLVESFAIVGGDNVVARLVRMLVNKLDSRARQAVAIFFNEQDGLLWLRKRAQIITDQTDHPRLDTL